MLKIKRETDYAIRCLIYLAEQTDKVLSIEEISKASRVNATFVAKILQSLAKSNLIRSFRGVNGGFCLARNAAEINLLDIIVAIEGRVALNECVVNPQGFECLKSCTVHPVWVKVKNSLEEQLRNYSLAELI